VARSTISHGDLPPRTGGEGVGFAISSSILKTFLGNRDACQNTFDMRIFSPSSLLSGLALLAVPGSVLIATDTDLVRILPGDTLGLVHVRSVPELRSLWDYGPLARTWAEPELQAFFAPALERFREKNPGGLSEMIQAETGQTPGELLDLFPGEFAFAIANLDSLLSDEEDQAPRVLFLARIGDDPKPVEDLFIRLSEDEGQQSVEEAFQGETIRTVLLIDEERDSPVETFSWAVFDGILALGTAKPDVQEMIDNAKRGGADEPLSGVPGFQAIYRDDPDAHIIFYLNLKRVVKHVLARFRQAESARKPNQPSPLAMVGMTPDGLGSALGLDQLTTLYGAGVLGKESTSFITALKWTQRPEFMKILTYGDPPAPRPEFVPDHWVSVSSVRFSPAGMYEGLKEVLRVASPALSSLLEMRIAEINRALSIDIERDLVGNFGDEIVQAEALNDGGATAENALSTDRFYALSIRNADTTRHLINVLMVMVPGLAQTLESREYLGETIYSFTPASAPGQVSVFPGFSYAVTRNYLFIVVGGPSMLETAIQGLEGASNSLWTNEEIAREFDALPPGESMIAYQDIRRIVVIVFDLITREGDWLDPEDDDPAESGVSFFDLAAKPSPEVLARHWGVGVSAIYMEPDGVRSIGRLSHGETGDR